MPARGRPTGSSVKAWENAIRKASHAIDSKEKTRKLELLANALVNAGIAGDISALREIGDRLDGKAHQTSETTITDKRTVIRAPSPSPDADSWRSEYAPAPVQH